METLDLEKLVLLNGSHTDREAGVCLMEAVAWMAGEKHSDRPQCVERCRATFGRRLNDASWPTDSDRTAALRPILPMLIGTADRDDSEQVRYFFADKAVREWAPMALESRGRKSHADRLRAIPSIINRETAIAAGDICYEVRNKLRDAAAAAAAAADDDAVAYAAVAVAYAAAAVAYAAAAGAAADVADDAVAYAAYAADDRLKVLNSAAAALKETCEPGFFWPRKS